MRWKERRGERSWLAYPWQHTRPIITATRRHLRHLRVRKKRGSDWPSSTNTNSLDTCYALVRVCVRTYVCVLYTIEKKKGRREGGQRKRKRERKRRGIETIRFRKLANQGSLVSGDVKAVCSKLLYHIHKNERPERNEIAGLSRR